MNALLPLPFLPPPLFSIHPHPRPKGRYFGECKAILDAGYYRDFTKLAPSALNHVRQKCNVRRANHFRGSAPICAQPAPSPRAPLPQDYFPLFKTLGGAVGRFPPPPPREEIQRWDIPPATRVGAPCPARPRLPLPCPHPRRTQAPSRCPVLSPPSPPPGTQLPRRILPGSFPLRGTAAHPRVMLFPGGGGGRVAGSMRARGWGQSR